MLRAVLGTATAAMILAVCGSCGEEEPGGDNREAELLVDRLVDMVARTRDFPNWKELVGQEDVFPILQQRFATLPTPVRRDLIGVAANVGADPKRRQERWLFSSGLAKFLASVLLTDPEREVRNRAARILVKYVPDSYLRACTHEIVEAAKRHSTDDDILLLGKTGAAEARRLLSGDKTFRDINARDTEVALAKLGDTSLSVKFVRAFEKEADSEKKAALARVLGYIGDSACVLALAKNIRNPLLVRTGALRKPLRDDIAAALSNVFPENPVFWVSPVTPPQDDSWYESMEKWLQEYLDITWDKPRPPFERTKILPTPVPPASQ